MLKKNKRVSIIIPVWNELEKTKACIESVVKYSEWVDYRIVVINNGSDEETSNWLESCKDISLYIKNDENKGFVVAVNQWLADTMWDDIILLNNDTEVTENWIEEFQKHIGEYDIIWPLSTAPHQFQYKERFKGVTFPMDIPNMVAFFCVYITAEVIKEVGLMDENYEIWLWDDDDYCAMARNKWFKIWLVGTVIKHHHRTSINKIPWIDKIHAANGRYYRKKHWFPLKVMIAVPNLGNIRVELVRRLMTLKSKYHVDVHFSTSRPCSHNRNTIVDYFLKYDHDFLLQIDSDIVPPENFLDMVDNDVDICSPIMYAGQLDHKVWLWFKVVNNWYEPVFDWDNKLKEVDAVGSGCLLVKREVLEGMPRPHFNRIREEGKAVLWHDLNFCRKAKELWFKVFYDTRFKADHYQISCL